MNKEFQHERKRWPRAKVSRLAEVKEICRNILHILHCTTKNRWSASPSSLLIRTKTPLTLRHKKRAWLGPTVGVDIMTNKNMCGFASIVVQILKFNVLLTVHHAMILGNCPT